MEFLLIIAIIILVAELSEKNQKIDRLEMELYKLQNGGNQTYNNKIKTNTNQVNRQPLINNQNINYNKENKHKIKEPIHNKMNEKEIKNSAILITGAVLIILASIIFLTSTWGTIHSFVKLSVFILMLFVFAGASYIAENILKIKQTAKIFFYISLTYFPMTLFSISWLGLLGSNLSLHGEYQYIYFTLCSIITALIYYFISKKKESVPIYIANIFFQLIAIILLILNFTNKITIILIGLLIYSIIVEILYLNKIGIINIKINYYLANIIPTFSIVFLSIPTILYNLTIIEGVEISNLILIILLTINSYIVLTKVNKLQNIYEIILPVLIVFTSLIIANLEILSLSLILKQVIIIISIIPIILISLLKKQNINIPTYITITLTSMFVYSISLFNQEIIPSWVIILIHTLITLMIYFVNEKEENIFFILSLILIMLTTFDIISYYNLPYLIALIVSTIILLSKLFSNKNSNILMTTGLISVVISTIAILNFDEINYINSIFLLIPSGISIMYAIKDKFELNKLIGYIGVGLSFLLISYLIDLEVTLKYIIPIYVILIMVIETIFDSLYQEESKYYVLSGIFISSLLLIFEKSILNIIVMLVLAIATIIYRNYYKLTNKINLLVAFILALCVYVHQYTIETVNINYIISLTLISISVIIPTLKKKTEYFPIISYSYIFSHTIFFDNMKYFPTSLFLIASIIYTYISNDKTRKSFLSLTYIFITILYNMIISDLNIDKYTLFSNGYYLILTLLFTRTIIKTNNENNDNYKILEYVFFSLVCFFTIGSYSNEFDGILFVSLLVIITIVSYIFKFGPAFICSIIFIIINAILLTREFWGSIPGWIYILVIGSIFIAFAVRNELNEKNKKDMKKKLNDIKKHLDM